MSNLNLPERVVLSTLHQLDAAEARLILDQVTRVARERHESGWAGEPTTLVIVPSSEVTGLCGVTERLQALARLGRKAGVQLRLIDVLPPLLQHDGMVRHSILACGSIWLREFVDDPATSHVTYHQVSAAEMCTLTEAGPEAPQLRV